ncbi:hypothetical protein M3M35_03215 [Fructilactobacillus myrtifloralis]|uniref:MBL fold metallo-hydrolase n=1 Tax=Fructilactobacillus myrtifloralis TaxID=2940301 RepID=A0ABY5BRW5_9LACO|nr:hypothetical protein [Fructilactobacillus myrtifloralis]USS85656.1 hypothetical protein M3M35_03215 [Fructilactobacillus myrtifloralis]
MSIVKFYNVDKGDMAYINHNSDNFSIIDCNLNEDEKKPRILDEIKSIKNKKGILNFISTHPDEDHFHGIELIDEKIGIDKFYCVKNKVKKNEITTSFKKYSELRDGNRAKFIDKGLEGYLGLNCAEPRGYSGLKILWPDTKNEIFKEELKNVNNSSISPNNISPIIKYSVKNSARFMWMGDLETDYIKKIEEFVDWPQIDILLAPHHGRKSGHIPNSILRKLNPKLIILGHAESKDMDYYSGWNTILKNKSGDIVFSCTGDYVAVYVEKKSYVTKNPNLLKKILNRSINNYNYIGSINVKR